MSASGVLLIPIPRAQASEASLTNLVASRTGTNNQLVTVQLSLANGSNGVPYNLYQATSLTQEFWRYLGPILASTNAYVYSNQPLAQSWYRLSGPPVTMAVAWGDDTYGQIDVPFPMTNVISVAAGLGHSLALQSQETVTNWGYPGFVANTVPTNLPLVKAIAAGWFHNVALFQDGTVTNWGLNGADAGYHLTEMPAGLTNVTAIAVNALHSMALRSDGTVLSWGYSNAGETNVPSDLSNVVAIAAGGMHSLAVKSDGSVVPWGSSSDGQCSVPAGLSNVTAVAAGWLHSLALKSDGTVVAWGDNYYGQTNVPSGLSNVVAISAGCYPYAPDYSLALQKDGTVVAWGAGPVTELPTGMDGVTAISAGSYHAVAVRYGRPTPVIIHQPATQYQIAGQTATFAILAQAYGVPQYQWQAGGTNIAGATNSTLTFTNVGAGQEGYYSVIVSDTNGSIVSTSAAFVLVTAPVITSLSQPSNQFVPYGSNWMLSVSATAPGQEKFPLGYQWSLNGASITNQASSSYTFVADASAAGTYTVTVSNAAGATTGSPPWIVKVFRPGGVAAWGADASRQTDAPLALTNVIAVTGGRAHSLALNEDGTVVAWGDNQYGQTNTSGLSSVVAIAAGDDHNLALKIDSTVVAWGRTNAGQTVVPNGLSNVVAIAAGGDQSLALLRNGAVTNWGASFAAMPAGLTSIMAVAAGTNFCLALRSNGTVVAWGDNSSSQTNVPLGLTNVVAIAAGGSQALALKSDGSITNWGATSGATPAGLTNVMGIAAGYAHCVALRNDGTVVTWGDSSSGQALPWAGLSQVKSIAAGGNHTLAAIFSSWLQYPVDVTKDLLLIYNSTSTNSIVVKDYYLAHRPLVGSAKTLGISCPTGEVADLAMFRNQIVAPVLQWLTNNPTKHPQYLILFPDLPTQVHYSLTTNSSNCQDGVCPVSSVAYGLSTNFPGNQPFVTSINMGLFADRTNDCVAYINKLAAFGTNGQLVISASAGGYTNTNYLLDDIRHGPGYSFYEDRSSNGYVVSFITNALLAAGVPAGAIWFTDGLETCSQTDTNGNCTAPNNLVHPNGATNLAGYMSWGSHSSLGNEYARNGTNAWGANSGWWIIETAESFNGWRDTGQGNFTQWFSNNGFGGSANTHYENTPVGAVTHTDEPNLPFINDGPVYFGLWASGKNFAICAWNSRRTHLFQAVGDPFVRR
jgi:alpha-tubulin suppressor-like RCC1 family protein